MNAATEQVAHAVVTRLRGDQLKTEAGHTFGSTGMVEKKQRLFMVTPGVDLADALQTASDMLDAATTPVFDAGMGTPLVDNPAWLVFHAIEAAKAVVDAACEAVKEKGRAL